ncbi:MAG: proliferating cell nuclear antigen (pcna) [Thermoprotei archaeon]|nr:MAG: proliferating cell nuclear antigen (pcna) [Thermoprotei archaeon]RLF16311.1 MAG: proliferating cell nuclear antigen (pcna) [Thermoprotei archaeon]
MVKVVFHDAKLWRSIIQALSTMVDEATFTFSPEGIRMRAMDPSRIAMVDFEMPSTSFEEYDCEAEAKAGVNLDQFNKLVKRASSGEKLELELKPDEGRLRVRFRGRITRGFAVPLLDLGYEELPTPRISFNVQARLLADAVEEALKDAELVSDHVKIQATPDELVFQSSSDKGESSTTFSKEGGALLELNVKEPSRAMYSLSYLTDMMKASAASDIMELQFSTNIPLTLIFDLPGGGRIQYWLAPRLEE